MKKLITLLIILFPLVGCDKYIIGEEIRKSIKFCEKHDGLSKITLFSNGNKSVQCLDMSSISFNDIE